MSRPATCTAPGVVRALAERYPERSSRPWADRRWRRPARPSAIPWKDSRPSGSVEVVTKLRAHWRLLKALRQDFRVGRYDLVILIDYPGFHLRVAEAARQAGTKVLYYIAPQLWAWRPERARRLAAAVDRLAVVLPFEQQFFGRWASEATTWATRWSIAVPPGRRGGSGAARHSRRSRILAIFPGSRSQEIRRLWEPFRDAAYQLLADGRCDRVVVAGTAHGIYPDPGPRRSFEKTPPACWPRPMPRW